MYRQAKSTHPHKHNNTSSQFVKESGEVNHSEDASFPSPLHNQCAHRVNEKGRLVLDWHRGVEKSFLSPMHAHI